MGGIVDIRDNAVVEGTILSMANLDFVAAANVWKWGSNVGNWEGAGEVLGGGGVETSTITITPDPDNVLPLGYKRRYRVNPNVDTYEEISP